MKSILVAISLFLGSSAAFAGGAYLCGTGNGAVSFTDSGASAEATRAEVMNRCQAASEDPAACGIPSCETDSSGRGGFGPLATNSNKKCASDADCQGFANRCFAGRCTQPGYGCASDADCPGFANRCFARKCTRQEPLCNSDKDCKGFANRCFAGKCTNP